MGNYIPNLTGKQLEFKFMKDLPYLKILRGNVLKKAHIQALGFDIAKVCQNAYPHNVRPTWEKHFKEKGEEKVVLDTFYPYCRLNRGPCSSGRLSNYKTEINFISENPRQVIVYDVSKNSMLLCPASKLKPEAYRKAKKESK